MKFSTLKIKDVDALLENETIIINFCDEADVRNHRHHFIELAYVLEGHANHTMGEKSTVISKGDYFIVEYDNYHKYKRIGNSPFIMVNCLFVPQLIDATLSGRHHLEEVFNSYLIKFDFCHLKGHPTEYIFHDDDGHIWDLVRKMCEEYENKDIGYIESMRCHLILILMDIMRQLKLPNPEESEKDMIRYITYHVQRHFMDDLSLKRIAEKYNYSSAHVSNTFKKETGITFQDYVQTIRVQEACQLLATTKKKVSDVAMLVGYSDVKFFSEIFKRKTSMTPREFRKTHNQSV